MSPHHGKATSAPGIRRSTTAALSSLALLLLLAALPLQASAAPLHTPAPFSPITGAGIGTSFAAPSNLAVDEATGNVFVLSGAFGVNEDNAVIALNAEGGAPVGIASPFEITGFDFEIRRLTAAFDNSATSPNKGALYVPDAGKIKKFVRNAGTEQYEAAGELVGVPFTGAAIYAVAVDDDGNVYAATPFVPEVKDEDGKILVEENSKGIITKFSPAGVQLAQIEPTAVTQNPSGLALDSAGNLFVKTNQGKVFKYLVNGLGELEASNFVEVELPTSPAPTGIAVNKATDTLFVLLRDDISEYDTASLVERGNFGIEASFQLGEGEGIAVNSSTGVLYVSRLFESRDFLALLSGATLADVGTTAPTAVTATKATLNGIVNPRGIAVGECKFEVIVANPPSTQSLPCEGTLPTDGSDHQVSAQVSGLPPDRGTGNAESITYRLVVTNANGTNRSAEKLVFTEPIAKTTAASSITPASATLNGVVHPEGSPITACKFEFGPTDQYGTTLPCTPDAGAIPADFAPHALSAEVGDLLVGTTYHYRLVVSGGGLGAETGDDLTFTALGPSIDRQFFSALTESSVTLKALLNPRGKATTYHFEYGSQGPCDSNPCSSVPIPDAGAGSVDATRPTCDEEEEKKGCVPDILAAQPVKGLTPDTTYHFRVVVTNPDGTGHAGESTFTTYKAPSSAPPCPDERFRAGLPSAGLPDCRAYEQATPIAKNGNNADGGTTFKVQASRSGDGITSQPYGGMPGGEGSQSYPYFLSRRGVDSWSTQGLLPPPSFGDSAHVVGWTPDLEYSFSEMAFASSDKVGGIDKALLLRSSATGEIQQLTPYLDIVQYSFAGASEDNSKLFFEAQGKGVNLTGDAATSKPNLYLYEPASEEMSLVGVLPDGATPPGGSFAGPFDWWSQTSAKSLAEGGALGPASDSAGSGGYLTQETLNPISDDGSRAFFTAGGTGQIYLREGLGEEEPETSHVSASQRSTPDPEGAKPATFLQATPDGSKAFFMSCEKLTDDSTAHATAANACDTPEQGQDLYVYDTESQDLADLTVDADDPQGAEVIGFLGASDDGSFAYVVANGDLDGPGGAADPGDCRRDSFGRFSYTGACNLYALYGGSATFVAEMDVSSGEYVITDAANWVPRGENNDSSGQRTAHVSADGQTVVFRSQHPLTDYDNNSLSGDCPLGRPLCPEFFRYHVGDPGPTCVTCNPTGAPPVSGPQLDSFVAPISISGRPFNKRFVSASGERVFFETLDKLAAADVNGDDGCPKGSCRDVYEWEGPGAGSCSEASPAFYPVSAGCLYLLSTGTSPEPSYFGDASVSGEDVFIFTTDQLVPSDKDQLFDVYDARVGGGLASQNQPPPAPPCEGQACRGEGTSGSGGASAGSETFAGPRDPQVKRCPKGKVQKGAKCVKKHRKHHRKNRPQPERRAGAGKGGHK